MNKSNIDKVIFNISQSEEGIFILFGVNNTINFKDVFIERIKSYIKITDVLSLDADNMSALDIKDLKGLLSIKFSVTNTPEYRLIIINNMDKISHISANSLLKTLEEISNNNIIVGLFKDKNNIPNTILSRSKIFYVSNKDIEMHNLMFSSSLIEKSIKDIEYKGSISSYIKEVKESIGFDNNINDLDIIEMLTKKVFNSINCINRKQEFVSDISEILTAIEDVSLSNAATKSLDIYLSNYI